MAYKAIFGGVELHNYFTILKVDRDIPCTKDKEKTIKLDILIKPNNKTFSERILEITSILNTKEPVPLEINDLPNKYIYAIVNSKINFDRIRWYGKATIEFLCSDPNIYSKEFMCYKCDKPIAKINNNGTKETYPIITIDFKNPACTVQLTDSLGRTILIGSQKDATISTKPLSNIVINDDCTLASNFTSAGNVLDASNKLVTGTFSVTPNGNSIYCNNYGTKQTNKWTGTAFRRNINRNLEQFEVATNFTFSSKGRNMQIPSAGDKAICISKSGALIKDNPSNNYNLAWTIAYYDICTVLEQFVDGHAKVQYGSITGWIETKYINRIVNNNKNIKASDNSTDIDLADSQMGCVECYGFDSQNRMLFKFQILDINEFFEFNKPTVWLGNKVYLYDNQTTPTPSQILPKDDNGNYLPYQNIESGTFGNWNDYQGTFKIRRKKLDNGKYRWWASINRTKDGLNVSQEINMGPGVVNDTLPLGNLNNLVFYIAGYSSYPNVTDATVNHIVVKDISNENIIENSNDEYNVELFNPGDRLEIDCENGEVKLNGENALQYLDIGSLFFTLKPGDNQLAIITDDKDSDILIGFKERFK